MAGAIFSRSLQLKPKVYGLLVSAITGLAVCSANAQNDLWLNPNGGYTSNDSNWSLGVPPVTLVTVDGLTYYTNYVAQFSTGAITPYTVVLDDFLGDILAQNDAVIMNYNGRLSNATNTYQEAVARLAEGTT